jgi:recombinational DNA repair protein (RecF pathway)
VELPTSLIDKQFRELLQADTKKAIQEAIAAIMTQHVEEKKLQRQKNLAQRKTVKI